MRRLAVTVVGVLAVGILGAVPAAAGPGDQAAPPSGPAGDRGGIGATATYQVRISGDVKGSAGSGTVSVGVPPTCWWGSTGKDATRFGQDYRDYAAAVRGYGSYVWYGMPGGIAVDDATADQQAGNAGQWYSYRCRSDVNLDESFRKQYGLAPYPAGGFPVWYRWVRDGEQPPPGYVAPQDLLEVAMRYIRLLPPVIGRSPAPGQDAITRLPTWLWVTADDVKVKRVRAEAGPVWVEVTAPSDGIAWSSPYAGATVCAPGQATTAYRPGATDSPCTLTWQRASWQGAYALTATNSWTATYADSDGGAGAVPDQPGPQSSQQQVRVTEVQVVNGGR